MNCSMYDKCYELRVRYVYCVFATANAYVTQELCVALHRC